MKKENVVIKQKSFNFLAPGGRGCHVVPGEGGCNKEHFMGTPSSPLRGTSPAKGEVNGGFTLIELLVVVLIIGILAAVAVPQYQVAVEKSRAVEAISNLKSLMQAEETFYYANGQYANQLDQLDIIISPQTSHFSLDISTLGEGRWVYTNSEKKYSIVASGIHRDTHYSTVVQGKIYCCNTGSSHLCKHIGREKVKETIACADAYWVD